MPVAVSPIKVRSTYVTDIRYREDAADLDKPEDLPVSILFAAFGNKSLPFCPLAAVFKLNK